MWSVGIKLKYRIIMVNYALCRIQFYERPEELFPSLEVITNDSIRRVQWRYFFNFNHACFNTHRRAVVVPSSCRTVVVQQMVSKINVNRSEKGIMRLNRREKMSSNVRYRYIRLKMIHFFRFQYYRVPVIFEFGRKKPDSGQKIASLPTTNNNATTSRYRDTHHSPYWIYQISNFNNSLYFYLYDTINHRSLLSRIYLKQCPLRLLTSTTTLVLLKLVLIHFSQTRNQQIMKVKREKMQRVGRNQEQQTQNEL